MQSETALFDHAHSLNESTHIESFTVIPRNSCLDGSFSSSSIEESSSVEKMISLIAPGDIILDDHKDEIPIPIESDKNPAEKGQDAVVDIGSTSRNLEISSNEANPQQIDFNQDKVYSSSTCNSEPQVLTTATVSACEEVKVISENKTGIDKIVYKKSRLPISIPVRDLYMSHEQIIKHTHEYRLNDPCNLLRYR